MKKLAEVTSVSYRVELTHKQFIALEKRDEQEQDANNHFDLQSILSGVTHAEELEFNGHFGAAVYFSLRADCLDDAEVVAKMIKMYATKKSVDDIFDESLKSSYNHRKNTKGSISGFESRLGRYKDFDDQVKSL
jgi:hypothetical protein